MRTQICRLVLFLLAALSGWSQNSAVRVPDVTGLPTAAQRNDVLRGLGLNPVHASAGQPPSNDLSYKVARQSPAAGTIAARGSTVTILIYDKYAPVQYSATLPSVVGMPWEQAIAALRGAGFEVRDVRNIGKAPSPEKAGRVASQVPAAGQPASTDRAVTLTWYDNYDGGKTAAPEPAPVTSGIDAFLGEWVGEADVIPQDGGSSSMSQLLEQAKPFHQRMKLFPGERLIPTVIGIFRNADGTFTIGIDTPNDPMAHWKATGNPTYKNDTLELVQPVTAAGGVPDNFTATVYFRKDGKLVCHWHMPGQTLNNRDRKAYFQSGVFDGVRR